MDNLKGKFNQIYEQYIGKIYRFVFLKVSSQEEAEDLTSRAFLKTWERIRDGEQIDNPQAFLYRVARNLVIDYYREKGRTPVISAELAVWRDPADPKENLAEMAALGSDMEKIKSTISCLNEDYQNAIIWRYIDDLPICEVAKLLDRTEGATRVLLHRAIESLRKQLS